jgi:hypothetical protein
MIVAVHALLVRRKIQKAKLYKKTKKVYKKEKNISFSSKNALRKTLFAFLRVVAVHGFEGIEIIVFGCDIGEDGRKKILGSFFADRHRITKVAKKSFLVVSLIAAIGQIGLYRTCFVVTEELQKGGEYLACFSVSL